MRFRLRDFIMITVALLLLGVFLFFHFRYNVPEGIQVDKENVKAEIEFWGEVWRGRNK